MLLCWVCSCSRAWLSEYIACWSFAFALNSSGNGPRSEPASVDADWCACFCKSDPVNPMPKALSPTLTPKNLPF